MAKQYMLYTKTMPPISSRCKIGDRIAIQFGQRTLCVEVLQVAETVRRDDAAAMYRELPE